MFYQITEDTTIGWRPDTFRLGCTSVEVKITDTLKLLSPIFKTDLREMNKFQMNDKEIVYLRPNQVTKVSPKS